MDARTIEAMRKATPTVAQFEAHLRRIIAAVPTAEQAMKGLRAQMDRSYRV